MTTAHNSQQVDGSLVRTSLPTAAAVELAHAVVQRVCAGIDVQPLFFKGPSAFLQGLRRESLSSDVDVLVAPRHVAPLVSVLGTQGWVPRPAGASGIALRHATTLYHPQWPVDIDIHGHIPGIGASPDAAFDALWSARDQVELAHWGVAVPSRVDHALILVLNALRSPWDSRSEPTLLSVAGTLSNQEFVLLGQRIETLKCGPAVAPFVRKHGRSLISADPTTPSRTWLLYQHLHHPAIIWMDSVERAPWRRKLGILRQAAIPSRSVFAERDLRLANAGRGTLALERGRRILRFARTIPTVVGLYWRLRRDRPSPPRG